jgi:hypothetical protein
MYSQVASSQYGLVVDAWAWIALVRYGARASRHWTPTRELPCGSSPSDPGSLKIAADFPCSSSYPLGYPFVRLAETTPGARSAL